MSSSSRILTVNSGRGHVFLGERAQSPSVTSESIWKEEVLGDPGDETISSLWR